MVEQLRFSDFNFAYAQAMNDTGTEKAGNLDSRRKLYLHCYHEGMTLEDVENWLIGKMMIEKSTGLTIDIIEPVMNNALKRVRTQTYSFDELIKNAEVRI